MVSAIGVTQGLWEQHLNKLKNFNLWNSDNSTKRTSVANNQAVGVHGN